jgi:hypothetical protein
MEEEAGAQLFFDEAEVKPHCLHVAGAAAAVDEHQQQACQQQPQQQGKGTINESWAKGSRGSRGRATDKKQRPLLS